MTAASPDPTHAHYAGLPTFAAFAGIGDPNLYRPLPDDWWIGLSDVVDSRGEIRAGRYKVVNTAGAAVIAAVANAVEHREFPFVFGGDGASFVVPPGDEGAARAALAATSTWALEELGLRLRVALVPVSVLREQGLAMRVARYAPSPHVSYAMFSGGGLQWAEAAMKAGRFSVSPAAAGARPDLTGLSCRWHELEAANGVILSLVLVPAVADSAEFLAFLKQLLALIEASDEVRRPIPEQGPTLRPPGGMGLDLELRAGRRSGESRLATWLRLVPRIVTSFVVFRLGLRVGRFDPAVYRRQLVENSDFRKYDDALRMTLDCTPAFAERMEERLADAERAGILRFGTHRQTAAMMTCYTADASDSRHFHFVDGAGGGYAIAASKLMPATVRERPPQLV